MNCACVCAEARCQMLLLECWWACTSVQKCDVIPIGHLAQKLQDF